jgi:CDP-glucose 4,6-dehydratase
LEWNNVKVCVTGGRGFVGSHIVSRLDSLGAQVLSLDITPVSSAGGGNVTQIVDDICQYESVQEVLADCQVVFHLAAQAIVGLSMEKPSDTLETNIRGTMNILEAVRTNDAIKALVIASTDKVYGEPEKLPIAEEHPVGWKSPYDLSKACADLCAQMYSKNYGVAIGITRCCNIYGPGDTNFSRAIPDFISAVVDGKPPVIRGHGQHQRDLIYIEDAVNAYITLAEAVLDKGITGPFNFGNGRPYKVVELAEMIVKLGGYDFKPTILGQSSPEIEVQYLDSTKARSVLGWAPKVSLEEGLERSLVWYKNYLGKP